jgi:uncharacterized membrane protein YidH (DUF202 family)
MRTATARTVLASRSTALAAAVGGVTLAVALALPLASPPLSPETVTVGRYGAGLALFCVWMAWFVAAGARYLREPE